MRKKMFLLAFVQLFAATMLRAQDSTDSIVNNVELEEITVTSTRLRLNSGLTTDTYSANELKETNTGVNLPYLLQASPSLVVTSDDGLGVGYTYFRIRGTDHTRINMTINGIPLNDSESQTVFWVNMTDLASSMNSVDLQRGVGSSTNGAAAFGASVNMQTDKITTAPFAEIAFNGGMYNTFRETIKMGTGLMKNGFAFDARFSKVNSDGYLQRASSDLYSYYASGTYYGATTMLKLMALGGSEKTYMAWDGISADSLAANRRYNPAGSYTDDSGNEAFYKNQIDNYAQQHYQLHLSQLLADRWNLNAALYYTRGKGYYEQYKTEAKFSKYGLSNYTDEKGKVVKKSDLVRQKHLDNHFGGGTLAVNYASPRLKASLGGAANYYQGEHFGRVLWLRNYPLNIEKDYEYYRNRGEKTDADIYLKVDWQAVKGLKLYGDLQYRYIDYRIKGINDEDLDSIPVHVTYNFFNPKAGISYTNGGHELAFNFAIANREPCRKNFTESGINDKPTSERLYDYELSYNYSHQRFNAGLNLYFMDYDNQLVLTGKYSDTGAYLTKNVKDSYRAGIELIAGVQIFKWWQWNLNMTLSQNKILNYTDWVDDWNADWSDAAVVANGGQVAVNYGTTDISFSPNIMAGSTMRFDVAGFEAALQTNYVGKQYLDNTSNAAAQLKGYCVTNLRLAYTLPIHKTVKLLTFSVQMNNLFNTMYVSNGGAYGYFEGADADGNFLKSNQKYTTWYYAQAGFNIHAGFNITF